jgi:predicted dehydrogenase
MDIKPVRVGAIGAGAISYAYLNTLKNGGFASVEMVGISDIVPERSAAQAKFFGIRHMTNDEILSDLGIEIVLNLTQLWNHHSVTRAILEAGKHVYSEHVMDSSYIGAKANYDLAKENSLMLGCAPDTYMGAAYQTARKLLDSGMIGRPLFAQAICFRGYNTHRYPSDAPDPVMVKLGSTITYDMAGYYINALVSLLGSVRRVSGYARFMDEREYTNPMHPRYRQKVASQSGTSLMMGCLEFENNCYANLVVCGEGFPPEVPRVEIFGTEGMLVLPDPGCFGGWGNDVYLTRAGNDGSFIMPFTHGFADTDPSIPPAHGRWEACHNGWRGIGVVDMAIALRRGRPARNSAELALHAVEIVDAIHQSAKENRVYTMQSRPGRPAPLDPGHFDAAMERSIDTL